MQQIQHFHKEQKEISENYAILTAEIIISKKYYMSGG